MTDYHSGGGNVADPSIAEQAQEKVQATAQQATQKTADYLRQQTEARASQASDELRAVSDALRRSGHSLHADGKTSSASAVDTVTQGIERLSTYLGSTSGDQMLTDLESFGRRRPWGMVGLGLGVGLVASRFLKASSSNRYASTQPQYRQAQMTTPPAALPPAPPQTSYSEPVTQVGGTPYGSVGP
jgi:ElaB/YqjD/DUF883 family membrane-anchored ribosome-binding protein